MTQFLPQNKKMLNFSKSLKPDVLVFGDFNIDTLKDHQERILFENSLTAIDLDIHKFEPSMVTDK